MKRFLIIGLLLFSSVDAASADSVSDKVFANLKAQGYLVVQQDRTWLGRIWVLARSKTVQREVVFDPTTGEILRDYAVSLADLAAQNQFASEQGGDGSQPAVVASEPTAVTAGGVVSSDPVVVATPPLVTITLDGVEANVVKATVGAPAVLP
jgi:hypothetical protein